MRLRVTVPNPDRRLKPEMFASVRIYSSKASEALTVPLAAVQRVGRSTMVFVQRDSQQFEARTVTLGEESGEVVRVLEGLREGEPVVVKGAFVLKSEAEKHRIEPTR
jgi:cobalt-zinc-cadmium efflux system membrane fusion protein